LTKVGKKDLFAALLLWPLVLSFILGLRFWEPWILVAPRCLDLVAPRCLFETGKKKTV
jgi:hypothetical protein